MRIGEARHHLISILILSLVLAASILPVTVRAQERSREGQIRVTSATHEVLFPDEVVFRLEAEADAVVTGVQLFYELERSGVSVYTYPSFVPGRSITAEFRLATSGSRYVPPGVDIAYRYALTDAAGNTLESATYAVSLRDPAYTWDETLVGGILVLSHDIAEARVREVAGSADRRLGEVRRVLGLDDAPVMKGLILSNHREADTTFPPVSAAATSGHLYEGFAFREFGLFALVGLDRDGMVHEMTHLLLAEVLDKPLTRVPAWLNEGLAMYFEEGSFRKRREVSEAIRDGSTLRIGAMSVVPGRPDDVRLFYAQSWSLVNYVFEAHGSAAVSELLGALDNGLRIESAVQNSLGVSMNQLEREWSTSIVGSTTIVERPDIGQVGTSALIAAATLVSVTAVTFGWLRRRRNPAPESEDEEWT